MAEFVRIGTEGHEWEKLSSDWKAQTESLGEEFDEDYQLQPDLFLPLIGRNDKKAGLYAIQDNDHYESICQINVAGIPSYTKPVMRVRHITFAPRIDLASDEAIEAYSNALVETFYSVVKLSDEDGAMKAGHIHFHLPSPADRQFFTFMGQKFKDRELFADVASKGAWLYITL